MGKRTKQEAEQVFYALGHNRWMQIIDADVHEYGPEVFDKGLHHEAKEPGFLNSLLDGMKLAASYICEPLTLSFYKSLHTTLCRHFKGEFNQTNMLAREAGRFRETRVSFEPILSIGHDQETSYHYLMLEFCELMKQQQLQTSSQLITPNYHREVNTEALARETLRQWKSELLLTDKYKHWYSSFFFKRMEGLSLTAENIQALHKSAVEAIRLSNEKWSRQVECLTKHLDKIASNLGIKPFVRFALKGEILCVKYIENDSTRLENITSALFSQYNKNMADLNQKLEHPCNQDTATFYKIQKLQIIAEFYQVLEWLHPFPDGQGRTDLVLLSKLLTEEGFTPAILDNPYYSSTATPEEWLAYLKNGMERWENTLKNQEAKNRPHMKSKCVIL